METKPNRTRVRLSIELVVYRIEEEFDPNTNEWEEMDTDVTADLTLDEGVVQDGETTPSGVKWHRQSRTQIATERRLQGLADRAANAK